MDDLVTWLRAQLDEDERVALAAAGGGQWRYEDGDSIGARTLYDEHWNIASLATYDTEAYDYAGRMPAFRSPSYIDPDANGRHMAHHDPTRVLVEVEAKRRILDEHDPDWPRLECPTCCGYDGNDNYGVERRPREAYPCRVVRWLALPCADRPGFREEW